MYHCLLCYLLPLLSLTSLFLSLSHELIRTVIKDEVEFWSSDCIVKETVWNRSEKADHLAYKYLCVLRGSEVIKIIINLAQSW